MTSYTVSTHDITESAHSVTASHYQIGTPGIQNMGQCPIYVANLSQIYL